MSPDLNIQFVPHTEINRTKWDACIDNAGNGLVYGYSFYLDKMARNWDGLVLNDYEAVMPLTWNKKYGIHYLYQPFLCAQLGLFGNNMSSSLLDTFLRAIPKRFSYWDIYFNHQNVFPLNDFKLYKRSNFVLDLNRSYDELYKNYRENIQRNIRKAEQAGCMTRKDFDVEKVIELALPKMNDHTDVQNIERFKELYKQLHSRQQAITYGIFSANNELLASCVFFFSHQRAYYILVGNHPGGRTIGASHALIDAFARDHAGKNMLLDFEGSDIPNLAFFYSSFGAMEENYAAVKLNRLPWYLKWMKQ
jgi:hypothetical protein